MASRYYVVVSYGISGPFSSRAAAELFGCGAASRGDVTIWSEGELDRYVQLPDTPYQITRTAVPLLADYRAARRACEHDDAVA